MSDPLTTRLRYRSRSLLPRLFPPLSLARRNIPQESSSLPICRMDFRTHTHEDDDITLRDLPKSPGLNPKKDVQCHAENRTPPIASVARSGRLHGILPASISTLQNMYVSKHPHVHFFLGGRVWVWRRKRQKTPKTPKLDGQASKQASAQSKTHTEAHTCKDGEVQCTRKRAP